MTLSISPFGQIKGLTEGSVLSGSCGALGDSGGPNYYSPSSSTFSFVGVTSAMDEGDNKTYFTPYQYFSNIFTPKTS